jgi:Na+(H+)/acetate symporter ActP
MASEIKSLDYVVLGVILMISVFIGLYHGFRQTFVNFLKNRIKSAPPTDLELTVKMNNEQSTTIEAVAPSNKTSEYLMANASMKTLPIAFSLLASVYSASSLLGMPAEVYQYGIQFWIVVFSQSLSPIIGAFVTVPFFAKFKVLSIFEYFEMRFGSRSVRLVGTVCYLLRSSISCKN